MVVEVPVCACARGVTSVSLLRVLGSRQLVRVSPMENRGFGETRSPVTSQRSMDGAGPSR